MKVVFVVNLGSSFVAEVASWLELSAELLKFCKRLAFVENFKFTFWAIAVKD